MLRERDPWQGVPEDKRLEFEVVGGELAPLAEATINKLDREWPSRFAHIAGAQTLFRSLTIVAVTTYETLKYFCADKPEDPARKLSFGTSSPPLLRSLVDEIYTVIFLGEDLEKRVPWYYRAGWREIAEQDVTYRERYGDDPSWKEWFEEHRQFLELTRKDWGISDTQARNPQLIRRWPTPGQMTRLNDLSPESKEFFEFLEALYYREFSQGTHLTFPGLSHRGGSFLRKKGDDLRENEWLKIRSDSVGYAVVLLLALLTEINHLFGLALGQRCAYLWGVLSEYLGIAKELYSERYESLLASR
jgi:hypothetical protein